MAKNIFNCPLPDEKGYFGEYGGSFIPPELMSIMEEITTAYDEISANPDFLEELSSLYQDYVGRPSPIFHAKHLSKKYGSDIYLKREDLNHTGAHKINHCLGEALLAKKHEVVGCVRQPSVWQARFPEVKWLCCDYSKDHHLEDWLPRLSDIEVVINAVGIIRERRGQSFEDLHTFAPIALFKAAKQVGIRKIIQISALGADDNAESTYHLSKRAADKALLDLEPNAVILYPSIVIGRGGGSTKLFSAR